MVPSDPHLELCNINPSTKVAPFTCDGPGTPSSAPPDPTTIPPCGYTYFWKSLADRTNGSRTWPVTGTTDWKVTSTASNGNGGALNKALTPTNTQNVAVGEWRASLVANPGG